MFKYISIFLIGAGLSACSSYSYKAYNSDRVSVDAKSIKDPEIDSLIAPYSRALATEMNRVIGVAANDMQVARPNSTLGQWVANTLLNFGKDSLLVSNDIPVIALLNTGGIRATLTNGPITVGDIFKLMPFDNQVVALKLPIAQLTEIGKYIQKSGGEPIAGFTINGDEVKLNGQSTTSFDYFWVITTDYLANGGDKMLFFQTAIEKKITRVLLRDVLLQEVERSGKVEEQLEERIHF